MELAQGEQVVSILVASKAFGEINPGRSGFRQVELMIKRNLAGSHEAELKMYYDIGANVYRFQDLQGDGIRRIRKFLEIYSLVTNQPGVFREYDFTDCRDEEEMRYRLLAIPEFHMVKPKHSRKVISMAEMRQLRQCPVCKAQITSDLSRCANCGLITYKSNGRRYFESERASLYPLNRRGEKEATIHLCQVDYINIRSGYTSSHTTLIEEPLSYLGAVYTITPPAAPQEFSLILNKPKWLRLPEGLFGPPYRCREICAGDLEDLKQQGLRVLYNPTVPPALIVSFNVWDYACLEEIGSHVNYVLYKYNSFFESVESTI